MIFGYCVLMLYTVREKRKRRSRNYCQNFFLALPRCLSELFVYVEQTAIAKGFLFMYLDSPDFDIILRKH